MAKNGPIRDQRRQELIQATIAVIARHGYSGTTVARVARKAGVSTGLMNFHFDSKDRLFRATFDFLAAEYQAGLGPQSRCRRHAPAARVTAMIESYFDRRVFTGDKLAVWFTFWSDAALRDRYRAAAARIERRYIAAAGDGDPPPDRRPGWLSRRGQARHGGGLGHGRRLLAAGDDLSQDASIGRRRSRPAWPF